MKLLKNIFIILCIIGVMSCGDKEKEQEKVPALQFIPRGGTAFSTPINVVIECDLAHVRIMYTTDGTDPTEHSILYSEPVRISTTTTLKAKAYKSGYSASDIAEARYTLNQVQDPIFSLASGIYFESQVLTLRTITPQAEIYFTINGHEPIQHPFFLYEEPISLPTNEHSHYRIQAKAFRENWATSETVTRIYEFRMPRMLHVSGGVFNPSLGYTVSLNDFYISNYQISQAEWREMMEGNNNNIAANPSWFREKENNPVEQISWYEAIVYCNRRSMQEGFEPVYTKGGSFDTSLWGDVPTESDEGWDNIRMDISKNGYRLPTEMEWEFAARGGNLSKNLTYSGSNNIDDVAWYRNNSGNTTHPVGEKEPNELQLYDMSGNVWEWCWDWHAANLPSGTAYNPEGPDNGKARALRGGSYLFDETGNTVSARFGSGDPWYKDRDRGFRVVRM